MYGTPLDNRVLRRRERLQSCPSHARRVERIEGVGGGLVVIFGVNSHRQALPMGGYIQSYRSKRWSGRPPSHGVTMRQEANARGVR